MTMPRYQHHWNDNTAINIDSGKVVCVGRNYADHIAELNSATPSEPVFFLKPNDALCDANKPIKVSHLEHYGELHHELEIALLIGENAQIIGLGLGLDLTLRTVQSELKAKGLPWERAKSFDGSCPISNFVRYNDSFKLDNLELCLTRNGQCQQKGNSALMLYPIPVLLAQITQLFSLNPGDVVLTGTPAGVGPLLKGDIISAKLNQQTLIDQTLVT